MRIDAVQWFNPRRKYFAVGVTGGIFLLVLLVGSVLGVNQNGGKESLDKSGVGRYRRQVADDDDELHDAEIYAAVVQSIQDWSKNSKAKAASIHNSHHRVKRDEEIVCYGELGCFRDEGPFDYLDMLPSAPEEISTKFLIFTRKNSQNAQTFSYFNFTSMFGTTHFNASLPTKVIIHGFGSTCTRMWAYEMQLAILQVVEANIICVDWENGAALPNYVRAAVNTRLVGKQVALLIFWLNEKLGTRTEDFHLIGFSLGAHVAGFAGSDLQNLSRITGLDPAGPLFESYDPKVRLDSSDALFVDVIHSNGDSLLMGGLGSWEPMGHVDFYPNGGRVQKGCSNLFLGAVRDFLWSASDGDGRSLCNHRRAYKFFTESLSNRCRFPAFSCESYDKFLTGSCFTWDKSRCGDMGFYADRLPNPKKGLLYLITRDDEPFCANQYRITVESSPSSASISTYGGLEAILIGHDFVNETFLITQTLKDNMVAGNVIQRMIVAHPAITEPIQIQLKYTAYQGWLYSGISRWSLDSLILTNAYGKSMSFCTRILLPSGIPVTIRLTAGVCLNRFPPAVVGIGGGNSVGGGRPPMFPLHPYDTYPTPGGSEINTTPVSGEVNGTKPTSTATFENILDLDLSMKPPGMSVVQNTNSNSAEIGPPYSTDVDYSSWQPLTNSQFRPSIPMTQGGRPMMGTPVEFYPHVEDEATTSDAFKIDAELEVNTLTNNQSSETESPMTSSTSTPAPSPVLLRICHMVGNEDNATVLINGTSEQKMACLYPVGSDPMNLNATGTTSNGSELNELSITTNGVEQEALQSNILYTHSNSPTSTDLSIPPESFWTAMHNQTNSPGGQGLTQYQGADPDVILPPHLSYILQQLEVQGLGPKISPINPHLLPPNGMASNTIGNNNNNHLRHFGAVGLPNLARVQIATAGGQSKHRGLVASSRALKHRPVAISIRRQSKLLDPHGSSSGTPGGSISDSASSGNGPAIYIHFPRSLPLPLPNSNNLIHPHAGHISQNPIVHISQDQSLGKTFSAHNQNLPPPFGARVVPVGLAGNTNPKKPPSSPNSNPIFFVTTSPKGYYLMPHYSFTNERGGIGHSGGGGGRLKLRRLIAPGSSSVSVISAGGGSSSLTSNLNLNANGVGIIVPTVPTLAANTNNNEINLNVNPANTNTNTNINVNSNGNFYDEQHRLRHIQNKLGRQVTGSGGTQSQSQGRIRNPSA